MFELGIYSTTPHGLFWVLTFNCTCQRLWSEYSGACWRFGLSGPADCFNEAHRGVERTRRTERNP